MKVLITIIKILASSSYAKSLLPTSYVLQNLNRSLFYTFPLGVSLFSLFLFFGGHSSIFFLFWSKKSVGTVYSLRSSLRGLKAEPMNLLTDRFCLKQFFWFKQFSVMSFHFYKAIFSNFWIFRKLKSTYSKLSMICAVY